MRAMYPISQDVLPAETLARLGEPSGAAESYTATVQAQGYHPSVSSPKPSYYFTLPDDAIVGAGIDAWWPFGPPTGACQGCP